jgi:ankyrin repeat protein
LQPNVQDEDGCTPLHLACTESNVPVAKALLDAGTDVSIADVDEETPLVRACYAKSVELVDLLLKEGSDPDDPFGRPLEIVVRAPSLESLKLLIAAGADISRNTYLSFASEHNYLDMMKVGFYLTISRGRRNPMQASCIGQRGDPTSVKHNLHH